MTREEIKNNPDRKRLHRIYRNMIERCSGGQERFYRNYVQRGITICDEWIKNFDSFFEWAISNGYKPNLSIDRIDNSKGYSPDNCRWATQKQQMNNYRDNVIMTLDGVSHTLSEWSEITGINRQTLYYRKYYGWSDEKALTTSVLSRKNLPQNKKQRKIIQKDKNGLLINVFNSITEAAKANNVLRTSIINNLKKRSKHCGGYVYEYE